VARDFKKDVELVEIQKQYSVPGISTGVRDIDIFAVLGPETQSGKPQVALFVNERATHV
jgi:hypothetical protein